MANCNVASLYLNNVLQRQYRELSADFLILHFDGNITLLNILQTPNSYKWNKKLREMQRICSFSTPVVRQQVGSNNNKPKLISQFVINKSSLQLDTLEILKNVNFAAILEYEQVTQNDSLIP